MNLPMVYQIIYALAARDGRERVLFGESAPQAYSAFERSLACDVFPELWFEVPLVGSPWFDLHVLTAHEDLIRRTFRDAGTGVAVPEVFEWYAAQGHDARQLALSWDTGSGDVASPAVQLLKWASNVQLTCDFLEAAGRADAIEAYRAFEARLPEGWFACYAGVFPTRREPFLRVECIPPQDQQRAYSSDLGLLADHLGQVGMRDANGELLRRCQMLAATPFQLEFQFDVLPDGLAGSTFSASVRFAAPVGEEAQEAFYVDGEAGALMQRVEAWGLADDRWRLLADVVFSKRLSAKGESCMAFCYPAFLKLRWRDGVPVDAKAYLIAGAHDA